MTFHIGALRRLFEIGALSEIERISSVSGGSIAAAHLALRWDALMARPGDIDVFVDEFQQPLFDFAGKRIDAVAGGLGMLTPGRSIATSVAASYRRHLFGDATLADLPDDPRFVFCATNLGSGALVRFSKPYTADYRIGKRDALALPLADVVAASAAFPPVLSPMVIELGPDQALTEQFAGSPDEEPPELAGRDSYASRLELSDGGVYDNLGMQPIEQFQTMLVSDGGGPFQYEPKVPVNWLQHMIRAWKVTDNQVRALRRSGFVDELENGTRHGAFWGIQTTYSDYVDRSVVVDDAWADELKAISTRLWHLDRDQRKQLVNWGYAVCDAAVRTYVSSDIEPATLPYPDAPLDQPPAAGRSAWWKFWKR
jgi:NTE family protein